jgi:steroid delta-isomerase
LSYAEPAIHEILISDKIGVVRLTWTLTTEADGQQETATEEGMDIFVRQPDGKWSIARFIAF